ncbi:polysaccharide deacetylase family protein [Ramlibacter sp. H39-3-26]|uniref:polysaccharide deacetylase family protein n=1 Tax=Curvibacter soli TaxID=3031331 RepID=UPI0023DB73E3|nr:polysaccharide deacetylase family protein [Ramlibacter sp. H39-3-26]MDF1483783.1 polysaccharide deacetylase family protein [Ramlibacter sp. H39-3-26]
MARIALKIDVDTWRGTREGVPPLTALLREAGAGATFLFSLGPDHTGRAIFRALRPGFLQKVSRTSVVEHYGLRTLLYGVLLPGPDIGLREAATLRAVRAAGFEVGVHCWDHVRWQDHLLARDAAWAHAEMRRALERFTQIFGTAARVHGAAGWQFNEAAAHAEQEMGIAYASDTRGTHPFMPVAACGAPIGPAQLPTTLPTLDELIGLGGITEDNVHEHLLERTHSATQDHVYTLHAELEGMRLQHVLRSLIAGWRTQGHALVSLADLHATLDPATLPRLRIAQGTIAGRSGLLALQGEPVAA